MITDVIITHTNTEGWITVWLFDQVIIQTCVSIMKSVHRGNRGARMLYDQRPEVRFAGVAVFMVYYRSV